MRHRRPFAAAALLVLAAGMRAQQGERRVPVTVTATAGRDVYLDRGRADGVEPGTVVRLHPAGARSLELVVRSASRRSARAEVEPGTALPPVRTRGEARVASVPPRPATPPAPAPAVPEHPPWSRQEEPRDPDQPLLVPTFGTRPEDRPLRVAGALTGIATWLRDRGAGRRSDHSLTGVGLSLDALNPFGQGGRLLFDGAFEARRTETLDLGLEEDDSARIDRLAWFQGEDPHAPVALAVGRFWSPAVPELGLVDGLEVQLRVEPGVRLGAGAGAYPLPFPDRQGGDDLGFHLFAEYESATPGALLLRAAWQQTWHEGHPDRSLLVLGAQGRPSGGAWLAGSAKIDLYSGGDALKSRAIELTEFTGLARWDGDGIGGGLVFKDSRWPDIDRALHPGITPELVQDGRVRRLDLDAFWAPTTDLRLSGFVGAWTDQDGEGRPWELAAEVRGVFGSGSSLRLAAFETDGSYNAGPGARALLCAPIGAGAALRLGYGWHRSDIVSLQNVELTVERQSLQAGFDWTSGAFDLDLTTEYRFGDQEDAWSLALFAQYRF